jgi:glutamine amidotransferase
MQVLFDTSNEHGSHVGFGQWPGAIELLHAPVLPHMGWNTVSAPAESKMFDGIAEEHFYFVHSYAATSWQLFPEAPMPSPVVTYAEHGQKFVAAVENGPLWATQFHPEKSGAPGLQLLQNWVNSIEARSS